MPLNVDLLNTGCLLVNGSPILSLYEVGSGIVWAASGGRKLSAITNYFYGDNDQSGLNFYVQPSTSGSTAVLTEAMRITSDGNVGIGTTSPGSKLTVAGSSISIRQRKK